MPEQHSERALAVTTSGYEQPFITEIWPYGKGGLNLKDQLDAIPIGQFSRHTNLVHTDDRGLTARDGLTSYATGGTNHHSVRRLSDPQASTYTRFWGVDQDVRQGQSGAVAVVDTGYSGDPLYLLPHRPPLSGDPWMFVADRSRMRKIRFDGLVTQIGLPAPGAAATVTAGNLYTTGICSFDAGDGTQAANWTGTAGQDRSQVPITTGVPTTIDTPGLQGNSVLFLTSPSPAQTGYNSWWGIAKAMDLTVLQGGAKAASDDDLFHLWMRLSHPQLIEEIRIYLVCSAAFDPTILPGTDIAGLGRNTDAYLKTFRQDDFSQALQGKQAIVDAAETARVRQLRDQNLRDNAIADDRTSWEERRAQRDPAREISPTSSGGAFEWVEFGVVGIPVRRGDFKRIGQTALRNWSTVTGIIVYLSTSDAFLPPNTVQVTVGMQLDDCFLYGGDGPDTTEPGAQQYDWRTTHYDPRTGAESNPSPEMTTANKLDLARREAFVTPAAFGDAAMRQRIYRRGGSLNDDWYFCGVNASDGGVFTDGLTDDGISTAGTVNLDHYQPVPTVNDAGTTVLAQSVPVLFGPANGLLFALGDPYRPGHLYWCIPDEPDHWPAESNFEVCSPSEELMAGLMHGAQPYCFSRERLYAIYPNLGGATEVTVTTTGCRRGLVSRHGWTIAMGSILGIARDGVFETTGGAEAIISQDIQRLFDGLTWNGYAPIDFAVPNALRLSTISEERIVLHYQGTDGNRYALVYFLLYKYWTQWDFAPDTSYLLQDEDTPLSLVFVGGRTTGIAYRLDPAAFSDNGIGITCTVRTGTWDLNRPRIDKLLGDQILDVDPQGVALTLTNRLNNETVVNAAQSLDVATGRTRYILDSFGTIPQRARNISTDITWTSSTARPTLYFLGQSFIEEPDVTINRVTQWDDLGHPDEFYLTGVTFDCDTGGVTRTIIIERDFDGAIQTVATLSVNTSGRRKVKFSWTAVQAHKVRIRPNDDCIAWILYRADWIRVPEPPRIAGWDIHFEAEGDQYYTGLDLYCDTNGAEKQIVITVDGVQLQNTHGGVNLAYWPVITTGRQWIHLTLPWGRGHVFHFYASDANPGLLYKHKWYVDPEPSEQQNFNQNFSIYGTQADKWLKALILELDTFGMNKSVEVQVDGVTVETLTFNATGRKVVQLALTQQRLGRVWRMFPVDGNPGRLYSALPIFDVEPFKLTRWETQETDHDLSGFQQVLEAHITVKSTQDVTLTLSTYLNEEGLILTDTYTIPSTDGVKVKRFVPFKARKGVLTKYLFTSSADFFLYQEESAVLVQPWGSDQLLTVRPFGDDDTDRTRNMINPELAAARSGGGT